MAIEIRRNECSVDIREARFRWRRARFDEAVRFMQGKILVEPPMYLNFPAAYRHGCRPGIVAFADGTTVVAASDWSGPLSELTPDIDAEPPEFWIGELEPGSEWTPREG